MPLSNKEITERRKADLPDAEDIATYRAYAAGEHPEVLTVDQQRLIQQRATHGIADNVIALILKTAAARLRLTEWTVDGNVPLAPDGGDNAENEAEVERTKAWLDHLWLINRVKRLQYEVHYATLRDGNSAVSLTFRGGMPRIHREPWWNGETGAYIAYTDAGEYEFAVREWKQREADGTITVRRTVYDPGVITRWYQDDKGWKPYERPGVPAVEQWGTDERSLDIPWVHFPNGSAVTDGNYGQSDIGTLLALQDDLNALQRDLTAASSMTAFQRLFFAGVANPTKIKVSPGSATGDESPDAKVSVIGAGDMSQLTDVHTYKRAAMLIASSTPLHVIAGDWPSGEALMRADMKLIEKVEALADVAGPMWTMTAHRATEIANAFGGAGLNENLPITSVFAPAERLDEATQLDLKQRTADLWDTIARLPKTAMLKTGLVTEEEADAIIEERDAGLAPMAEI